MIKLTKEARSWYRSSMVWFLGLAGFMEIVGKMLPQVQGYLPDGWYGHIQIACVAVGAVARFVRQPRMQASVAGKEADRAQ